LLDYKTFRLATKYSNGIVTIMGKDVNTMSRNILYKINDNIVGIISYIVQARKMSSTLL